MLPYHMNIRQQVSIPVIIVLPVILRMAICSVSLPSRLLLSEYWCYENAEHTSEILGAS